MRPPHSQTAGFRLFLFEHHFIIKSESDENSQRGSVNSGAAALVVMILICLSGKNPTPKRSAHLHPKRLAAQSDPSIRL